MFILLALAGLLYSNFMEWLLHKVVLHGWGKDKRSFWSSHFRHHKACTFSKNFDKDYVALGRGNFTELKSLLLLNLIHLPVILISPAFYSGALLGGLLYFTCHRKCHVDVNWGKKYMPWHYAHHMKWSSSNWCVTYPLFDILLGTYKPYEDNSSRKSTQDKI